jgi:hypothetical protein
LESLQLLQIDIAEMYYQFNEEYGSATRDFANAFISEKENSFKATISEIEYRIKSSLGGITESLKGKMFILEILFKSVASRVDYLIGLSKNKPL